MASVLGRLGAGAVFTSFIMIFFVERPLMAYRGAENVGTVRSGVYLISWRGAAMWPSGNRQSVRDLTVEIVCDGSVVVFNGSGCSEHE